MCVAAFFLSQKNAPVRDHEKNCRTCSPDVIRKTQEITKIDGYRRASKECQLTIQPEFEFADRAFLFLHHCCICVFFSNFGRMSLSFFFFFFEICGRISNEMFCRRNSLVTKRWVRLDKKKMRTHIPTDLRRHGHWNRSSMRRTRPAPKVHCSPERRLPTEPKPDREEEVQPVSDGDEPDTDEEEPRLEASLKKTTASVAPLETAPPTKISHTSRLLAPRLVYGTPSVTDLPQAATLDSMSGTASSSMSSTAQK